MIVTLLQRQYNNPCQKILLFRLHEIELTDLPVYVMSKKMSC